MQKGRERCNEIHIVSLKSLIAGKIKEEKTENQSRNKSFNDLHFKDMIIQYLRSFSGASRAELNTLLQSKLSDVLTEEQKIRKIGNMLSALKKEGIIKLTEKKKWVLVKV